MMLRLSLLLVPLLANLSSATQQEEEVCDATKLTKLRLGLEWFVNPDHLPILLGVRHGIFTEFGLDVELLEPQDHWEAENEILSGRMDVALTEPLHLAQDAAAGKPVLGFSRFFHTDGGVMYNKQAGIRRPLDMCGKTISYPGSPGPGGPAIVNTMVQADGLMECNLTSYGKYNGGFFHTDALQSGKADVATLIFWNFEIPEATARGMDVGFFSLKDWGVPDFCQLVLMTTPARFVELKDALRRLILAMRRAVATIHQHPQLAIQTYRDFVYEREGTTELDETAKAVLEATLQATLPAFPNDNMMSNEYYDRLMAWLVETKQVEEAKARAAPVETYWTNEIAW